MSKITIPIETQHKVEKIILDAGAIYKSPERERVFIDTDKFWSLQQARTQIVEILMNYLENKLDKFDLVCGITSQMGSFGTVPLCSILAYKLNKDLIIFEEDEFAEYILRPTTSNPSGLLKNRRLILLKDVILHAQSLKTILASLAPFDCEIISTIVMVDLIPNDRSAIETIVPEGEILVLLEKSLEAWLKYE